MRGLKAAMGAIESIGSTILKFAKGAFSKLGNMFEDVMGFFKGILKWGDEGKLGDNVLDGATDIAKTDRKAATTAEHADDLKKGKGPKEEPKKKPYGDDAMRNAAYAAVAGEVVQSNVTHEPMSKFKLDIGSLRAKFPIIRSLDLVPSIDGGYDVWMTASPKTWAGHKVKVDADVDAAIHKKIPSKKSWISHDTYNEVRNRFGKDGVNKFVNAMKKGFVSGSGENGIKVLTGEGVKIGEKIYKYEIKVKGTFGDWRIFGNYDKAGNLIFDNFRKGIH